MQYFSAVSRQTLGGDFSETSYPAFSMHVLRIK